MIRHFTLTLAVAAPLTLLHAPEARAEPPAVDIGIVMDGYADLRQRARDLLEPEVMELMGGEFDVRIPADKLVQGDGTIESVRQLIQQQLTDPQISVIVAAGAIASHVAAGELGNRGPLSKPVIAPFVIDADLQGLPLKGDASGVENLNYIAFPSDVRSDLREFRNAVPFDSVALVLNRYMVDAIPGLRQYYLDAADEVGVDAHIVAAASAADVLEGLGSQTEAVFVALPLFLPKAEMDELVDGLIERRLPSFSARAEDVKAGLLVGLHTDADLSKLARRIALNIQRILLGENAGTLTVVFQRSDRLTINMATARAMRVYPSWSVVNEAEQIAAAEKPVVRQLTLIAAVQEAVRSNLDLAIMGRAVAAGEQSVRQAKANLLPQIGLSATGIVADEALASPFQAERQVDGTSTVTQVVYSEAARANASIRGDLQRALAQEREQVKLNVAHEAAMAYLNVLRAETFERIQKNDLDLTRSNLELARVRQQIGMSGPAETYRWESQMATARNAGIQANTQRNVAQIALNRILHRPLEEDFDTQEIGLHDENLITHDPRFIRFIDNKHNFGIFRNFMVEDGMASAPELKGLDAAIAAQSRALTMAQRAHYLPTVALKGDATRHISRDGEGSGIDPIGGDANWTVGLNATFPLYQGGAKFAASKEATEELEGLRLQRQAVAERVEQRIRSALHHSGAAYAGIGLSEEAAIAAVKNLELVEDAYGRGVVSILDLLDAQNAQLVAEEGAANAVFDFLLTLMEVERSIGKFYFFADETHREAWFAKTHSFFEKAGDR